MCIRDRRRVHGKQLIAAVTRVLGYDRDELLGRSVEELYPPEHRTEATRTISAILAGVTSVGIVPVRAKDGTCIPAETVVTRGRWNKRPALLAIGRDLSDRERARHALAESTLSRTTAEELQRLSRSLVSAQEAERRRIAMELHDEVGQNLTGLLLLLEPHQNLPQQSFVERVQRAREIAVQLMNTVRRMSLDLRPAELDYLGLCEALTALFRRYTEQTGVRVEAACVGADEALCPDVNIAAYRIIQEALTNVARHSGVEWATVSVTITEDEVSLAVEDRGRGFDLQRASVSSTGLAGMRERAMALGGRIEVVSRPGIGTQVRAHIPRGRLGVPSTHGGQELVS
eukprot:TRINITY_DN5582_c0_g2_i3.p2 TRINITY_DN5582_c0_g2~~TRINITY_DN5582_c0_g2_i3.p2  ORF type:complete len:344 (+),score=6.36 TRINITY_DN5582_c0_g2_i3:143-1174(+)